jgi:hypothetical protein
MRSVLFANDIQSLWGCLSKSFRLDEYLVIVVVYGHVHLITAHLITVL